MKIKNYPIGLLLTCLLLLSACAKDQPLPEPAIIKTGCPAVTACTLSPVNPSNNGDMLSDAEVIESDWAKCAAKIDAVIQYNEAHDE